VTVKLTEGPHHPQGNEGGNNVFSKIWSDVRSVGAGVASLFKEDPGIRTTIDRYLTDDFVREFADEFRRMMRESREGAESFSRLVKVNGWGHGEDMFQVVRTDILPQELKSLRQPYCAEMITKLSDACGLHSAELG